MDAFPAQIVILSTQVYWSQTVEQALDGSAKAADALRTVLARIESTLEFLADRILNADITPSARKKYEQVSGNNKPRAALRGRSARAWADSSFFCCVAFFVFS